MKNMIRLLGLGLVTFGMSLNSSMALEIDNVNSSVQWKASKKLGAGHHGTVALKQSRTTFDQDGTLTAAELEIDLKSADVTDLDGEYKQKFLGHIMGEDFFQVEKYPTAKLVATSIKGDKVTGNLTIKGKTQPVSFTAKREGNSYRGKLVFDRTKFGVIYGSGNFFKELTADKIIANEVEIDFTLAIK